MSVIYILQNAGFSSFPDQASCLQGWDLNPRDVHRLSDPESICGRWPQGGPGPSSTSISPRSPGAPGSMFIQGFGCSVCSVHWARGIQWPLSLLSASFKAGPQGTETAKGIELGQGDESLEKLQK